MFESKKPIPWWLNKQSNFPVDWGKISQKKLFDIFFLNLLWTKPVGYVIINWNFFRLIFKLAFFVNTFIYTLWEWYSILKLTQVQSLDLWIANFRGVWGRIWEKLSESIIFKLINFQFLLRVLSLGGIQKNYFSKIPSKPKFIGLVDSFAK